MSDNSFQMECFSLALSLFSSYCSLKQVWLVPCANLVGMLCAYELSYLTKKDMILHHIFVLFMLHYMNSHREIDLVQQMTSVILSTKISTIFLTNHSLFDMMNMNSVIKNINKVCFVTSYSYYRMYKYTHFIMNAQMIHAMWIHSRNYAELVEIWIGTYGICMLNMYWGVLIFAKLVRTLGKIKINTHHVVET